MIWRLPWNVKIIYTLTFWIRWQWDWPSDCIGNTETWCTTPRSKQRSPLNPPPSSFEDIETIALGYVPASCGLSLEGSPRELPALPNGVEDSEFLECQAWHIGKTCCFNNSSCMLTVIQSCEKALNYGCHDQRTEEHHPSHHVKWECDIFQRISLARFVAKVDHIDRVSSWWEVGYPVVIEDGKKLADTEVGNSICNLCREMTKCLYTYIDLHYEFSGMLAEWG